MITARYLAIANPRAGGNARRVAQIAERLARHVQHVAITERAGHATALAAAAAEYDGIVAVGGDGTVFEVLQGMNLAQHTLIVLPAGRANTLSRDLSGDPRRIDVLEVDAGHADGTRRVVRAASTVAMGYPCEVAAKADARFRFLRGGCYGAAAACTVPVRFHAEIGYDGRRLQPAQLTGLVVNNTRFVANFLALRRANCADGAFDAMELRRGTLRQLVHNFSAMARLPYEPVRSIRASSVHMALARPQSLVVDGEFLRDVTDLRVRVLGGVLTIARMT